MSDAAATLSIEPLGREVLDGVRSRDEDEPTRADLGLLPVFADERPLLGLSGFVDWRSSGRLTGLLRSGLCTGALGERVLLPGRSNLPVDRVVLLGLGARDDFDVARAGEMGGELVSIARDLHAREVIVAVPSALAERDATEALFAALAQALAQPPPAPAVSEEPAQPEPETHPEPEPEPQPEPEPEPEREMLPEAPSEAAGEGPGGDESSAPGEDGTPATATPQPEPAYLVGEPEPAEPASAALAERWWAIADERMVQRLRRLLAGPPRAAGAG